MHKILLVEDDNIIHNRLNSVEQWGYEVVAVEDFMDVLQDAETTMILMDIGLPHNGLPLNCQEIRKVSRVRSCFFPHGIKPWILSWPINMVGGFFCHKRTVKNVLHC